VYIGTKTTTGSPVQQAGLTNGSLYGIAVSGVATEGAAAGIPSGTAFTLAALGNVETSTGAALDAASTVAGVTRFNRPEDGAWDPLNPTDFYFATTASFTTATRLWRLRFSDLNDLPAGGTIDMLLDGSEGGKMFDNMTLDKKGHVYLQEDVGNNAHIGKVWRYTIASDKLTLIAQHNLALFTSGATQFLTQDEESSGIIDASDILGAGWFLLAVQAHYGTDSELVEGGQLLALFDPAAQ
jgi:secreted PhoX family phosphatase